MPKPDYKHDYYADLELRSNATLEDIKKQFKKLGKQYLWACLLLCKRR